MRDWWIRTLLVLQAPRPVFAALRDDSRGAAADRAEPVLAIVLLSGIAYALATPAAGTLMDDRDYDALLVAVWAFLGGSVTGAFFYFAFGALLYWTARALGSRGSYRRARHVVAFASVPVALSLVLWPVELSLYGSDVFRSGGADAGAGGSVFRALDALFLLWALALLAIGVRAVHGWQWPRAVAATAVAVGAALTVAAALGAIGI